MRKIVNRVGWSILGLHVLQIVLLGPTRMGGFVADVLEIAAALLAMTACWRTARRAEGSSRPFWLMFGAVMAAQFATDAAWSWLQDWKGIPVAADVVWMRNLPLLRTMLLTVLVIRDPDSKRIGPAEWLDAVQVTIVYVLSFLLVDYNTSLFGATEGIWLQFLPRALALMIAAVRVGRWRGRSVRAVDKGLLAYLAFYVFAERAAAYRLASASLPTGTWVDLAWTVSPVAVSWWAMRWKQEKDPEEMRVKSLGDLFLTNAPFAMMPLVAVLQAAQLRETYQGPRYFLLGTSFLCFAARLGISEVRQSRQMESLVAQDRRLRETHHELQVQTTLLEKLFASAPEAIAVLDANRCVLRVNAEFTRLFGYQNEEVPGRSLDGLLMPESPAGETQPGLDTICRAKNGDEITVSVLTSQVQLPDGQRVSYWIGRDIREKKRAEEQLLQSQKMEAVGRLAGGVAHDFNNLLTVINGYADLVIRTLPAGDKIREKLATIRKAGGQAAALTQQLLAFGRKQVVQRQVLSLNALIAESESLYRRLLGEDLRLKVDCGAKASVLADPGQMNQIVMNLLINARDAMPRGGTIEVRTYDRARLRHAALSNGENGCRVVLSVTDTGVGIDPSMRPHLFEPFFTTKRPGEGTGLGLATVYGILQQMGGSIDFESEPGRGTTFEVCFPGVHEEPRPAKEGERGVKSATAAPTILLVEDEENVREFLNEVLTGAGYRVVTCAGAEEGLAAAAGNGTRADLLVTDVVLPDLGGPELASRLQTAYPHLKVIFVSGYPGSLLEKRGVKILESSLLLKPFTPEDLLDRVRRALEE